MTDRFRFLSDRHGTPINEKPPVPLQMVNPITFLTGGFYHKYDVVDENNFRYCPEAGTSFTASNSPPRLYHTLSRSVQVRSAPPVSS